MYRIFRIYTIDDTSKIQNLALVDTYLPLQGGFDSGVLHPGRIQGGFDSGFLHRGRCPRGSCPLSPPNNAWTPPRHGPGSFQEWAQTKYTNTKKYLDHYTCNKHKEKNTPGLHGAINRFLLSVHHIQFPNYGFQLFPDTRNKILIWRSVRMSLGIWPGVS